MQVTGIVGTGFSVSLDSGEVETVSNVATYHGISDAAAFEKVISRGFRRYSPRTIAQLEGMPEKDKP